MSDNENQVCPKEKQTICCTGALKADPVRNTFSLHLQHNLMLFFEPDGLVLETLIKQVVAAGLF